MIKDPEIIIEGSYNYLQRDKIYSVENFTLSRHIESDLLFINAELFSRIETGEFLKIKVYYELNAQMYPVMMKIEKSLGEKYSRESFEVQNTSELIYQFNSAEESKKAVLHFSGKHYLSSPALSTSAMFSLTKKFDPNERNPIILVSGHDSWSAQNAAPVENIIYAEFNNRDTVELNIQGQELQAQCLSLFELDSFSSTRDEIRVDLLLSKHYSIPYQLLDKDLRIEIKHLKKHG